MKQCFKSIYGMPIETWLLQYRMNYAAERLLASPDITIADLAGETGYGLSESDGGVSNGI